MVTCKITGCDHKVKHAKSRKSLYSSWQLFRICPCCAIEIFPDGFNPPRGIKINFYRSSNCNHSIRNEIEEQDTTKRRSSKDECSCTCHKGIYGICLYCQEKKCSEYKPLFPNIKSNYNDTRVKDILTELRRKS